jgi:protein Tex
VLDIITEIARVLSIAPGQARSTVELLQDGATVPFIARYRKERTGSLDETQIRTVEERWRYFSELEERRSAILESIAEQGKLTDELRARLEACRQKQELEDLYLPFKPKRRTRAMIAREKGLEPLAERIWSQKEPLEVVERAAAAFVDAARGVESVEAALAGAQDILAERVADDADVRALVREALRRVGRVTARRRPVGEGEKASGDAADPEGRFALYYDHTERLDRIPHHRVLALDRGERLGVLRVSLEGPDEEIVARLRRRFLAPSPRLASPVVAAAVEDATKRLVLPAIEREVRAEMTDRAGTAAISLFGQNLRQLLLQPPVRDTLVVGIDPGLRTGCKVVVVDATGKLLEHATLYPHTAPQRRDEASRALLDLARRHEARLVAVGNGTASRETVQWAEEALAGLEGARARVVTVSEAGASVYSASPVAIEEFPDLDVTVRGAVSIARRLQDPLAELVKIDPKAIGVGQYQHDVDQKQLKEALDAVVESCVNYVGVDLNTASASLLGYVAGVGPQLARNIVRWREEHGAFATRAQLMKVPKLGPKAFQQAAGFLRVHGSPQPLDASAVHPERYPVVERMAAQLGLGVKELVGNTAAVRRIEPREFVDDEVGLPTLQDILSELEKPGRDPRGEVLTVSFRDDVQSLEDLREGMVLPGVITNITDFGAFVDVGVHQDGLVHISQMADRRIQHPGEVCAIGQTVQVRVLGVEPERRRISLSMKGVAQAG